MKIIKHFTQTNCDHKKLEDAYNIINESNFNDINFLHTLIGSGIIIGSVALLGYSGYRLYNLFYGARYQDKNIQTDTTIIQRHLFLPVSYVLLRSSSGKEPLPLISPALGIGNRTSDEV